MRWPTIIFSRICSLGVTYDIFPMSEPPICADVYDDVRDPNVHTVFLLPSLTADAEVLSCESDKPSPSAAMAGAIFLTFVRGLPLSDVEIESGGKIFKIFLDKNSESTTLFLPKCKLLCSNKEIFVDKTRIFISEAKLNGEIIPVVKCDDAALFSDENLKKLALLVSDTAPIGAVAYSLCGNAAAARAKFTNSKPDIPLICAMAVARAQGVGTLMKNITVEYGESEIIVSSAGDNYAISTQKPKYFTFSAPDIL